MSFSQFAALAPMMYPRHRSAPGREAPEVSADTILAKLAATLPCVPCALPCVLESVRAGLATVTIDGTARFEDVPLRSIRWSRARKGAEGLLLVSSDGPIAVIVGFELGQP